MKRIINQLREEFSSIWTLLNDTELFIKRIEKFDEYEFDFRIWRANIAAHRQDAYILKDIREEVVALRKSLRASGYDLLMGSKDIEVRTFLNDTALGYGFRRMSLVVGNNDLFYITGETNHLELIRYLELQLGVQSLSSLGEVHCLWYMWKNNVLLLFGADSESADDFEKFKVYAASNKMFMLKKFKGLR
jgi:hypothetical protein